MLRKQFGFIFAFLLINTINAQTNVSGNQSGTWTLSGSPYILVGDVTVPSAETLVIEPGVEVSFPTSARDIFVNGVLDANGTATDRIHFSGPANDYGGYIIFNTGSIGSKLNYCDFSWLGAPNSTYATAIYLTTNANTVISNCNFDNNNRDIVANISALDSIGINDLSRIELLSYLSSGNDVLPYLGDTTEYYLRGDLNLRNGDTLTIAPGANIYQPSLGVDIICDGVLSAIGTPMDKIEFYGPDDNYGGYVLFNPGSQGSVLEHCDFSRLGSSSSTYRTAIYLNTNSNTAISNCTFNDNNEDIIAHIPSLINLGINDVSRIVIESYLSNENDVLPFIGDTTEYYLRGDLNLRNGDTLTITPGVNIHQPSGGIDIICDGVLSATGTPTDKIEFYGPEDNYGGYILFNPSSQGSVLEYCDFSRLGFSGSTYRTAIYLNTNSNTAISNCTFEDNYRNIVANVSGLDNLGINDLSRIELIGYLSAGNDALPFVGDTTEYYLQGDLTISSGDTLTIAAGANIFQRSAGIDIVCNGILQAIGTPTNKIEIYGPEDDYGGYILFNGNSRGSTLQYCDFSRLGSVSSTYKSALYLNTGSNTNISDCTFTNNYQDIRATPSAVSELGENELDYIRIIAGNSSGNGSWPKIGTTAYYLEGSVGVATNDTITLEPGVEVVFPSVYNIDVYGTLFAEGTSNDSIYFRKTVNNPNYGGRLTFLNQTTASRLSHCVLDSMGYYSSGSNGFAISAGTSSLEIENSLIKNGPREGIRVRGSARPTIRNCRIENFAYAGINIEDNGVPIIDACHFENNNEQDIRTYFEGVGQLNDLDSLTVTIVSSTLDQFTQMSALGNAGKYRLESTVAVGTNDTLIIDPGVKILFPIARNLQVAGTLLANGTAAQPIQFLKEPSSNNYGGRLSFYHPNSISKLEHCILDSLGYYSSSSNGFAIEAVTSALQVLNTTIRNTPREGIRVQNSNSPTIRDCTIEHTAYAGINIQDNAMPLVDNCQFNDNEQDIRTYFEGVDQLTNLDSLEVIIVSSTVDQFTRMPALGNAGKYRLESTVAVGTNDTLMIDAGVKILFPIARDIQVAGTLLAQGTPAQPIQFLKEPSSNNYGGRLSFYHPNSISKLEHCILDSLGYYSSSSNGFAIEAVTSALQVLNTTIRNTPREGIRIQASYSPTIRNCTIENNAFVGINILDNAMPTIDACRFFNNQNKDIRTYFEGVGQLADLDSLTVSIVSSTINQFTNMPALGNVGNYVLENTVAIAANDTLMIEAGAKIWMASSRNIQVSGTILANGTAADSIYFMKDPTQTVYGGKITFFNASDTSVLSHCVFDSLGFYNSASNGFAIEAQTSALRLENSKVSNSAREGIRIETNYSPTIKNCQIENNAYIGIHILDNAAPTIDSCRFFNNQNRDIRTYFEGVGQIGHLDSLTVAIISSNIDQFTRMPKLGTAGQYLLENTVSVGTNDTLLIEPGAKILMSGAQYINVSGTMLAEGTDTDSIYFIKDPLRTDNGGKLSFFNTNSRSILSHCVFDSLGFYNSVSNGYVIEARTSALDVKNSRISTTPREGIRIQQGYSPVIRNCLIENNGTTGIYVDGNGAPTIDSCTFANNPEDVFASIGSLSFISNNTNAAIHTNGSTVSSTVMSNPGPGSRYTLEGNVAVSSGDTLEIEPGVSVHFNDRNDDIIVLGTLLANGNIQDSIKFLGFENPNISSSSHGGQIEFRSTSSNSSISYALIDQLGDISASSSGYAVEVQSGEVSITNTQVRNSENIGIYILENINPIVQQCNFENNPQDISIHPESAANIFDNATTEIYVRAGTIDQYSVFPKPGIESYYILEGDLVIGSGDSLKINPGVSIHFDDRLDDIIVLGTLLADGTVQDSIRFQGFANPNLSSSSHGGRIDFRSSAENSSISYAVIDQLGDINTGSNDYAIQVQSSEVVLSNNRISNSENIGVYILENISPTVQQCDFYNNVQGISIHPEGASNLSDNTGTEIFVRSGTIDQYSEFAKPGPNSNYVLEGDIVIAQGDTLKIHPGVSIHFDDRLDDLLVQGTLLANGTTQDSILFLGFANPNINLSSHGGHLDFYPSSTNSSLSYARVDRLGDVSGTSSGYAIQCQTSNLQIKNTLIQNAEREAIHVGSDYDPEIDNCAFENNPEDIRATISSLDNISDNLDATIYIPGGSVTENGTIPYPGANSYYQFTGDITLGGSVLLLIEPGVLVDFANQNVDFNINGTLQAIGTDLSPIQFVRLGGNSTNHGGRINVTSGSANSNFNYVNIDHLGNNGYALNISEASTSVGNLNITNSQTTGLRIDGADPIIVNSSFQNQTTGVYVTNGSPTFSNCNIFGNQTFGINNVGQDTVDARMCWWGDVSGPFHATNPGGLGNKVSDRVLFDPVLNEPPNNTIINGGILDIIQPVSDCNLSDSTIVMIELSNFGNITQSDFEVGVLINGVDTIIENVGNLNLLPGQTTTYSFTNYLDFSTLESYDLKAFVTIVDDEIPANDTLVKTIFNYAGISSPANLIPINGANDLEPTINFSWSPSDLNAEYNLYLWEQNESEPTAPTFANLSQISQIVSPPNLQYGKDYNWKVEAVRGTCISTSGIQTFSTKEYPDITVETVTTPNVSFSGQNVQISWQTKNTGNGSSGSSPWYDAVYFSSDSIYDGTDTYLGALPNIAALMPGESYTNDLTFTIPQGLQGNYYIIVRSDVYNNVIEANTTNNDRAGLLTITLTPPPDLQVESIITPNNAFSEQMINVTWTVTNEGTGATTVTDWYDKIYLSTDPIFNENAATLLKTVFHQNPSLLERDASYTETTAVTLPQGIFGDYYIHVVTDVFDYVYEYAFEDNNFETSNLINVFLTPPPDLIVQNIQTVEEVDYNQSFLINWDNFNQGSNVAAQSWVDRIYISALDSFNIGQAYSLGQQPFPDSLAAGSGRSGQRLVTMPDIDSDTAYVYVWTDASDQVYEFNQEENNTLRSAPIQIKKADLEITSANIPTTIFSGQDISISYTIENNGVGSVLGKTNKDRIFYSTNFPFEESNATYLGQNTYNLNLSPQQNTTKQKTVTIPQGVSGSYYFYIITDYQTDIIESDETNNIFFENRTIQLSPSADLQVNTIDPLPDSIFAGTTIPFDFIIANHGTAAAEGTTWTDKIYVSVDSIWTPADAVFLKEIERLQALPINDTYTVNTEVTLPMLSLMVAGLDSFSYVYLYVMTDATDQVYEDGMTNDNNVRRSEAMHVTCPPPVDLNLLTVSSIEDSLLTGEEVSVTWMVQNIGSTTEYWEYPLWYDGFFLSVDTLFDSGDIFIEDFTIPGPLDEGVFYSETQSIEIPNVAQGNYYLLMVADHQNRNNDADLTNNTKVIPIVSDGNPSDSSGTILITPTLYPDLKVVVFNTPATAVSGQPFDIIYTIENIGDTTVTTAYTDKVYLSTDNTIDNTDQIISSISVGLALAAGDSYTDTIEAIPPVTEAGNRIILFKTDANNRINEDGSEGNNILSSTILLDQPLPADLIVSNITELDTIMANEEIDLVYEVQNIGQNPANGIQNDVVYLSQDSLFDISDYRVGIQMQSSNLSPLASEERTLAMATTPGVPIGDYHVLVQVDALNNINELEETNNISISETKVHVTVPLLPLGMSLANTLDHEGTLFYKIEIPDSLTNETLRISLTGDSIQGNNEIFLSYEEVPSRASHDYAFAFPFSGNQELLVPELSGGTYYALVYGQHNQEATQAISIKAEIIDFFIQSVDASTGGNTGTITTRIKGARFEEGMDIMLTDSILGEVSSQAIYRSNSTSLFASFDLRGAAIGTYDVVITRADNSTAVLQNGFEIVEGSVGSIDGLSGEASGFSCSIKNYGVENLVSTNILAPTSVRIGRVVPITIVYGNNGNIDIPCPTRFVISLRGAPLGMTIQELEEAKEELYIVFEELNGPPGILRAGATGSITIYTKSTHPLRFYIQE